MYNSTSKGITLLGATGFLGSAIANELDRLEIPWIGISIEPSNRKNIVTVEPTDQDTLVSIINEYPTVINAAGSLKPKDFEENTKDSLEKFWKTVEHFTQVFERSNIRKLVHLSSAGTVYGDSESAILHPEESILKPISWYGKAKMFEEIHYGHCSNVLDYDYLCLRITNPYGNKEKTQHGFVDVLIKSVIEGSDFNYYFDCDPCRDFIYAPDMSEIILKLVTENKTGTYNVGSGEILHLSEIVNYVTSKHPSTLIKRELKRPSYDVINSCVSIDKIRSNNSYKNSLSVFDYIDGRLNK
ncbi:NAD-dependent epimerase/dehydratase family protein [Vibrio sp. sp1]|uniref:NAD-dependent epimerase/dehydratase family protein n=1 Tax=Vibrio TaxID=662 RepID=UPI0019652EC2|nr:NAD-dependent epimerase/dehydratase family protein [Vibrio sp. sp1]QRZ21197.1 NAD-dependent epimerase/dehydratase family protein [Vibrio sp. sp1]